MNFDLIYYCDSYPAIGNGHLKRCFDICSGIFNKDPNLKIAIMGQFSDSARRFINLMNQHSFPVFEPFEDNVNSKISMLDTLYKPGDVNTIDTGKAGFLKNNSRKLFVINTGYETFVPDTVDAIINYIPLTKYFGNVNFEKYFGFEYVPVTKEFFNQSTNANHDDYDILAIIGGGYDQFGPDKLSQALLSMSKNKKIQMIVSPHFPVKEFEKLETNYQNIRYLQNVPSIKNYMERSKAIICTYGNTTYESMAMGKPTFIVAYFDFQYIFADYLEKQKLACNLGYFIDLQNIDEAIFASEKLDEISTNCKKNMQGPGIENIANLLIRTIYAV